MSKGLIILLFPSLFLMGCEPDEIDPVSYDEPAGTMPTADERAALEADQPSVKDIAADFRSELPASALTVIHSAASTESAAGSQDSDSALAANTTDVGTAAHASPGTETSLPVYVVKPGDNLSRIASRHDLRVEDLMRWNAIDNPNRIRVGQELTLAAAPQ